MSGWTIGFWIYVENVCRESPLERERIKRKERKKTGGIGRELGRGGTLVGGRDPIHCVARIFAGYPIA